MRTSVARRIAMLDNMGAALNSGYIRVYDGTRPADPNTALSGNNLLAELTFGATAFQGAVQGAGTADPVTATANAVTAEDSAPATGTASFARLFASDGTTAIADGSVGVGSGEVQLLTLSIAAGVQVSCTSCVINMGLGS